MGVYVAVDQPAEARGGLSRSSSSSHATSPSVNVSAEFTVTDYNGEVEVRQSATGHVHVPGRVSAIGEPLPCPVDLALVIDKGSRRKPNCLTEYMSE